jgi:hypothetical protein
MQSPKRNAWDFCEAILFATDGEQRLYHLNAITSDDIGDPN